MMITCWSGPVAQWLEPTAHNRLVGGSSPPGPTTHSSQYPKSLTHYKGDKSSRLCAVEIGHARSLLDNNARKAVAAVRELIHKQTLYGHPYQARARYCDSAFLTYRCVPALGAIVLVCRCLAAAASQC